MKSKPLFLLLLAAALGSGCHSYEYRVVRPTGVTQPVRNQTLCFQYGPLEYRLFQRNDRLGMRICNPTDYQVVLDGDHSFAVSPDGESHPLRDRVIDPHSITGIILPPMPVMRAPWGPGWAWGWDWSWGPYSPFYDAYASDLYGPPVYYNEVRNAYDWRWNCGSARVRLTFSTAGRNFAHEFEFVRQPE
jgi:hypothetical protein